MLIILQDNSQVLTGFAVSKANPAGKVAGTHTPHLIMEALQRFSSKRAAAWQGLIPPLPMRCNNFLS
jgi:hypothetical protein